jgi:hypothetical protein
MSISATDAWSGFKSFARNSFNGEFDQEGSARGFRELCAIGGVQPQRAGAALGIVANCVLPVPGAAAVNSLLATVARAPDEHELDAREPEEQERVVLVE